jgi:hypothetical protein
VTSHFSLAAKLRNRGSGFRQLAQNIVKQALFEENGAL